MKNRRNLGSRIKDPRERGAWAELYFMALAAGQGLKISSPYGGFASYDVGVEDSGPILRVQVKCTMCRHPKGGYSLCIRGPTAACAAGFDCTKPSCYKQHRTRPCKKRKDGAPSPGVAYATIRETWATRPLSRESLAVSAAS